MSNLFHTLGGFSTKKLVNHNLSFSKKKSPFDKKRKISRQFSSNAISRAKRHISNLLNSYISEFENTEFPGFFENYKFKGNKFYNNYNPSQAGHGTILGNIQSSNRSSNSNTQRSSLHLVNESKEPEENSNKKKRQSSDKKNKIKGGVSDNEDNKNPPSLFKEVEIKNFQGLTKSNLAEFRNICDKIKENICEKSSKDSIKTSRTKQYQNENDSEHEESISKTHSHIPKEKYRQLTRKKYVYDSLDDEEVDDEINENFYISPTSQFNFYFDTLIFIAGFYSVLYSPLSLAKNDYFLNKPSKFIFVVEIIIDAIYFCDIIIRFFLAYITFDEILITNLRLIALHYIFTWFILDILTAIPFNSIITYHLLFIENNPNALAFGKNIFDIVRLIRIVKMLKIVFANSFSSYLFKIILKINHLARWIKLYISIFIFIIALHALSSVFIFIGKTSYPNWIMTYVPHERSFGVLYIHSLYYILSTIYSIGYGDILSNNMNERIFNLFLMVFGIMIYSWGLSSISTYIQAKDTKTIEFLQKCELLDEIKVKHEKMSDELYDKIHRFLQYKLKNEKKDRNVILDSLPIGLRNNMIYQMYKPIIENFIFFKNFNNTDFIVKVIMSFKPVLGVKNDILVNEGDYLEEIFFVKKGNLSLQLPLPDLDQELAQRNSSFIRKPIFNDPFMRQKASLFGLENRLSYEDITRDELNRAQKLYTNEEINSIHVQILEIRKNEHFGDILMFLNRKSPLAVKVKSKIVELFLLKKTDAARISINYPVIWNKIIKRSLFNMEQIDRLVNRAIKLFYNANKKKFRNLFNKKNVMSNTLYSTIMNINNSKNNVQTSKFNYVKSHKLTNIYKIGNISTSIFDLKTIPSNTQSRNDTSFYRSSREQTMNGPLNITSNEHKSEKESIINNTDNDSSSSYAKKISNTSRSNETVKMNINDGIDNLEGTNLSKKPTIPSKLNSKYEAGFYMNSQSFSILHENRKYICSNDISISSFHFKTEKLKITKETNISIGNMYENLLAFFNYDQLKTTLVISKLVQCGIDEMNKLLSYLDKLLFPKTNAISVNDENIDNKSANIERRNEFNRIFSINKNRKSVLGEEDRKSLLTNMHCCINSPKKELSSKNPIKQQKKSLQNFLQKKDNFIRVASYAFDEKKDPMKILNIQDFSKTQTQINDSLQNKKNENDLLDVIKMNIENNAFNLDNPALFYSEYFQKILDKEQHLIYQSFLFKRLERAELLLKNLSKIKKNNEQTKNNSNT